MDHACEARYALYFAPEPGSALARFGDHWFGAAGPPLAEPDWIAEAAVYGFHATLKAPFRLKDGETEQTLLAFAEAFARTQTAFVGPPLRLAELDRFLAFRPSRPAPEIGALAGACVTAFDRFRAPLMPAERTRRLRAPLTGSQIKNVDAWGYPYVFEDYRFHMTLTSRLEDEERHRAMARINAVGAPLFEQDLAVRGLTVFRQARPGRPFAVLARLAFGR